MPELDFIQPGIPAADLYPHYWKMDTKASFFMYCAVQKLGFINRFNGFTAVGMTIFDPL